MEEREALVRLKAGDIAALEVLTRTYQLRAVRAADLVVRDRTLAEDIVAETFLSVLRRSGRLDASRPFGPWFLRCVVNNARKAASRRERTAQLRGEEVSLEDLLPSQEPGPEALAQDAALRDAVWAALGRLSPEQRAAVVQRYYLGLSEQEMAAASGCPPGTIKWRLYAARERLRGWLYPLWEPAPAHEPSGSQGIDSRKEMRT